jgi:glutamate synthase domain-containing protein 1
MAAFNQGGHLFYPHTRYSTNSNPILVASKSEHPDLQ